MLHALFDIKAKALESGFQKKKKCAFFMATNNNNISLNLLFYETTIGDAKL